jgi:hypothetical protein
VLGEVRALQSGAVTLVGPSGVGKTEVALHLLATSEGEDHVFVDLTHAIDVDDVLATIAATLDVRARLRTVVPLREAISARRGLLVLDRCERAGDAVAEALNALALEVPVLCTSTRSLGYRGERAVNVDPLEDEAQALFLARSPMLRDPTTRERGLIDELIVLASGLPLAIELIASWEDAPLQLVRELDPRVERDRPLQSVAAWSIDRLDSVTRFALAQAAVIEGPFDSETFAAVVELPRDVAALDVLSTLASVALVSRAPREGARFVIAPVIRHLAIETLGDAERLRALRRHATFFASVKNDVVERSRERADWIAAHELSLVDDELPSALSIELAEALMPALLRHGPLERALGTAEATLARAPSAMLQVLSARARSALGLPIDVALTPSSPALALAIGELCLEQADHHAAASMLRDAARDPALAHDANRLLAQALVDEPAEALRAIERANTGGPTLAHRAAIRLDLGDTAGARADAMEALTVLAHGNDVRASALAMLTLADAQEADAIAADDTIASARVLARRAGDLELLGRANALDASRALRRGELATARALLENVEGPLGEAMRGCLDALRACRSYEPPATPSIARLVRRARPSYSIARDGSRAVLPTGPLVLDKRPVLRKLLQAFVSKRVESPGAPLAVADLFAAGWPGERVPGNVQGDRVHASLQALRDLGLRGYIVTLSGGWALDPDRAFDVLAT